MRLLATASVGLSVAVGTTPFLSTDTPSGPFAAASGTHDHDHDHLSVLGINSWERFRPTGSVAVDDDCRYEALLQIQHDTDLPFAGPNTYNYGAQCQTAVPRRHGKDGMLWLDIRQHWQELPSYVQAAVGFQHMSIDFRACGEQPMGHTAPTYEFSLYRSTPEHRAEVMNCTLFQSDSLRPGENFCDTRGQSDGRGRGFFVVARQLGDTSLNATNVPPTYLTHPQQSPVPHVGLRFRDPDNIPRFPRDWRRIVGQVATYNGDLSMVRVKVPYQIVGKEYTPNPDGSDLNRLDMVYHAQTIRTLPDTISVEYDRDSGIMGLRIAGPSGMCRSDFEAAEAAAGGNPFEAKIVSTESGDGNGGQDDAADDENGNNSGSGSHSPVMSRMHLIAVSATTLALAAVIVQ